MSNWLDQLLEVTDEAESPKTFIYWAGLAAIAAVMKKNVYLDKHYYKLYPNLYVMLVAKSGGRKGFPISVAKSLVQSVNNTKIISGRNSIQAVVKDLSRAWTLENGEMLKDATAFIVSEEFTTLVIDDDSALPILTTLYDTHAHEKGWFNTLKGEGQERLKDVCITLLGASNQTHFKDKVGAVDFTGGFVGRLLIVLEDKRGRINPLVEAPEKLFDLNPLIPYLQEISRLKGPFLWTKDAGNKYKEWYIKFSENEVDDTTGTKDRLHDQILKVAMLLALSRRLDLKLMLEDIVDSIDSCLGFSSNAARVSSGQGKSPLGTPTAKLIDYLLGRIEFRDSRRMILQRMYGDFDALDLDKIIHTMVEAGALKEPSRNGKGDLFYQLTDKFVEVYKKKKEAKNASHVT